MASLPPTIEELVQNLPYYDQVSNFTLFQNSGIDYVLVGVYFVLSFIAAYVFKFIILAKVKDILPERGRGITAPVLSKVSRLLNFGVIILLSLYLSTLHLTMASGLRIGIDLLAFGILTLVLYRFAAGLIDIGVDYRESTTEEDKEHILSFIKLVGKVAVATIALLFYLKLLDIDITGLVAGLGIAGITIAFALQSIVADLFAAVAIYLDKPFEIGDYIKVGDNAGRIERIGIRSTHVRSVEGPLIVMANQNLTSADITNYKQMEERRITQVVGVSADTPIDQLRRLPTKLTNLANDIDLVEVDRVWLKELGNYSWNYEIIYYVKDREMDTYRRVQEELNFRILELMDKEGIELPYPIQELFLNSRENLSQWIETTPTTD